VAHRCHDGDPEPWSLTSASSAATKGFPRAPNPSKSPLPPRDRAGPLGSVGHRGDALVRGRPRVDALKNNDGLLAPSQWRWSPDTDHSTGL
jgi:hypothetical protein